MIPDEKLDELAAIGAEAERLMERGRTWRSAITCGCIFEDPSAPDRCTRWCAYHAQLRDEVERLRAELSAKCGCEWVDDEHTDVAVVCEYHHRQEITE